MRVVPRTKFEQLMFFQTRAALWAERAAEIGVSEAEVLVLIDRVNAARAAFEAQMEARRAAQSATITCDQAMAQMAADGAALMGKIRANAKMSGTNVCTLAELPAPSKGSPIAVPGKPDGFTVTLGSEGALTLRWTCKQPRGAQGTMYRISRQLGRQSAFEFVGVVGTRKYVDLTLPPGTAEVTYQVQAIRSTTEGPIARHTANLGVPEDHPARRPMQVAA